MGRRYFGTDGVRGKVGESPITPEFVMHLGYAAGRIFSKGARGKPAVLLGNYLQKHPDDLRALKAQGLLQIASEQNDAAIATLSRVQSLEPDNPATLYTLAQLHHQKHDYARATEALQRYVALPEDIERDNGNAFLFLSEIAQKQNDQAGAIQWLERVPTNSRVHFEAQLTRASLLARQGHGVIDTAPQQGQQFLHDLTSRLEP